MRKVNLWWLVLHTQDASIKSKDKGCDTMTLAAGDLNFANCSMFKAAVHAHYTSSLYTSEITEVAVDGKQLSHLESGRPRNLPTVPKASGLYGCSPPWRAKFLTYWTQGQ